MSEEPESDGLTTADDIEKRAKYKEIRPGMGKTPKIKVTAVKQKQREIKIGRK